MSRGSAQRAAAIAAALCVSLLSGGCTDDRTDRPAGPPRDPVEAAVEPYLRAVGAELVAVMREDGHLGIYVRPEPAWELDRYVTQLPLAAEVARDLLSRFPEYADADLCADAPWLPHPSGVEFVPATRVQLFRSRMSRVPARFQQPGEVMRAGLHEKSLDFYVDPKIITGSPAYQAARKAAG